MPFQLVMVVIKHVINFWPSNLIWKQQHYHDFPPHYLVYWLTPVGFSSVMFVTCFPLFFMLLCVCFQFHHLLQLHTNCDLCDDEKSWISIFIRMELPDWDPAWDLSTFSVNMGDMNICPICSKKSNKYTYTLKCDMCQYTFHKHFTLLTEFGDFMQSGSQEYVPNLYFHLIMLLKIKISWIFWINSIVTVNFG